jgi:hypothetical protein
MRDAVAVASLFHDAADAMQKCPLRRGCAVHLPSVGRLLATGDLHDNPEHLRKIIKLAKLDTSPDHHVVLHEIIHGERLINGMDFSHRMLARIAELVLDHPSQVHPLLANHELSQLTGRAISKGAGNSVEQFSDGLEYAFGDSSQEVTEAINEFIRAMPLAVRSESGILCAHSLPDARMMAKFDLGVLKRDLADEDYVAPAGAAYLMVWGREQKPAQIVKLAKKWNVKLFVIGHRFAETGVEMLSPLALVLNSDHERAATLPLDLSSEPPTAEEAMLSVMPLSAVA